jgi:IS30 family transposase
MKCQAVNYLAEEKLRIDSLRQKRKKRFDFSKIHISWDLDFMEFTINHLRYKALIVVEHHSRRLLYARVILEPTAEKVARIIKALGKHYNTLPTFIKADNGPEFRDTFKTLMASLNITVLNSPRYYPRFNGVVERLNGSIRRMVQRVTVTSVASVNTFLSRFLDTHNYTPHESLGWLTPIKVFRDKCHQNHPTFTEVITPYVKDDCIRIRFTRRNGNQGRLSFPCPNTD